MRRRILEVMVVFTILAAPIFGFVLRMGFAVPSDDPVTFLSGQTFRHIHKPDQTATIIRKAIEPDEWDVTNSVYRFPGAWIIRRNDTATTHAVSPDILVEYYRMTGDVER